MANGGGDSSDSNVIHRKDGFSVPGSFFKPLLVGYGLQNKLEVQDEGRVILTMVNEGDNMFFLPKEVVEVDGGGDE